MRKAASAAALLTVAVLSACGSTPQATATPGATALPSPRDPQELRIAGISMEPLLTNGDMAIVDRAAYSSATPQRGDVVLMVPPDSPTHAFVKRVIGVPGDRVQIDGRHVDPAHPGATPQAAVLVQPGTAGPWEVLVEPYLPKQAADAWTEMSNCCDPTGRASAVATPLVLLDDDYFVLGDNRNYSADSRSFGLITRAEILGKVLYRVRAGTTSWLYTATPRLVPDG